MADATKQPLLGMPADNSVAGPDGKLARHWLDLLRSLTMRVNDLARRVPEMIITVHGALAGLDADDHPQYLNNARGDARYVGIGHNSNPDPHTQYHNDARGDLRYAPISHTSAPDPHPQYLTAAAGSAAYQPLDSDLTAIAALSTTTFGRGLLALLDAAALRVSAGLVIGTNVQAYNANLAAWAGVNPSSYLGTAAIAAAYNPISLQGYYLRVYSTSTTWTPVNAAKLRGVRVTATGGGGGGAGSDGFASNISGGTGGASGATSIEYFTPAMVGASQSITIGAAGTAGPATSAGTGGIGGTTSFGALISAAGGAGGFRVSAAQTALIGEGPLGAATPTTGHINLPGQFGGKFFRLSGTEGSGGDGGASYWGPGGRGAGSGVAGVAASNAGAGGGGACVNSATALAGGAGGAGRVVVEEFY